MRVRAIAAAVCAVLAACTSAPEKGPVRDLSDGPMPDFALTDVNISSPSYWQEVSPRDYSGQISAWYFGHAT